MHGKMQKGQACFPLSSQAIAMQEKKGKVRKKSKQGLAFLIQKARSGQAKPGFPHDQAMKVWARPGKIWLFLEAQSQQGISKEKEIIMQGKIGFPLHS